MTIVACTVLFARCYLIFNDDNNNDGSGGRLVLGWLDVGLRCDVLLLFWLAG